ncbi:MAG: PEP-CTERM sorting domain-containing protein [Verrucomicrobiota bacterium]
MKIILTLLFTVSCSLAQTLFSTDFNGTIPASIDAGTAGLTGVQGFAGLGPAGNPFGGTFLRSPTANTVKLQLTALPPHTAVNIAFLLAAIDSLDGEGSYPSGDYFHIRLDGVTIFRESLANAITSQIQSYVPTTGAELARWQDLGFTGPGSYYRDSAYNFGLEPRLQSIPHTSSTLTLEFVIEGVGVQDINDESWAIDNLTLTVTNGAALQNPQLANHKVTYPVGNIPRFTGILHGATPLATATLQSSTDLGIVDAWDDLTTLPVNLNGSASFTEVPDPSATGAQRNFYRVKILVP